MIRLGLIGLGVLTAALLLVQGTWLLIVALLTAMEES